MCCHNKSSVLGKFCQLKRTFCHEHMCPQIMLYISLSKQLFWKFNTNVHHDGRTRPHHEYFRSLLMPQGIKTEARYGTFANIYVELGSSGSSRRREGRGFRSGRSPPSPSPSSTSTCIRPPPQAAGSRRREGRGW